MDALTIAERDPLRTTGKIWRKSPPRTTGLPPNGTIALAGFSSESYLARFYLVPQSNVDVSWVLHPILLVQILL
jgi:hypothetical protein